MRRPVGFTIVACLAAMSHSPARAEQADADERQWVGLTRLIDYQVDGMTVRLRLASAVGSGDATSRVLSLGFPLPSVVRIRADEPGDFAANGAFAHPVKAVDQAGRAVRITIGDAADQAASVMVDRDPLRVTVLSHTGRELVRLTEIAFDGRSGAKVPPEGWRIRFPAGRGEAFYGFGERFNAVNQRGQTVRLWGADAGMGSFLGIRATAYKNIPFFLSSRRYAMFWDSSYRLTCDMGDARSDQACIVADGPILDLYIACHHDPKASLTWLSDLTGKPLLPPKWAFAPWMGREAGAWQRADPKRNHIAEMLHVVGRFEKLDIPHSAIYAEGPGSGDRRLYAGLEGKGIRVLSWHSPTPDHWSNVKKGVNKRKRFERVLLRRKDGSVFIVPRGCFRQGHPYFDFTHPGTIDAVREEFRELTL